MSSLGNVMRTDYVTVAPEDTLGEAAEKLVAVNVGAAVVKDFGRLIGILTERDIMRAVAGRVHTSEARVREWMTAEPLTASPDTPVEEAARTMLEHGFRHLPVVDDETVLGVVSLRRLVAVQGVEAPGPD
jgi:CBS domain-containing protein